MKNFSKLLLITLFGSLIHSSSSKADSDYYAIESISGGFKVFSCINNTGTCSEKASVTGLTGWNAGSSYVDKQNNLIIHAGDENYASKYYLYNPNTENISAINDWRDDYNWAKEWKIVTESNGTTSIGKNSLKLKETSNSQEMWATNSSGSIAPINITNGTKLLINGRDVEQSIDNVGALSAALTGLPTIPTDSPIACGIGTGTHSGNYAFSGGCVPQK